MGSTSGGGSGSGGSADLMTGIKDVWEWDEAQWGNTTSQNTTGEILAANSLAWNTGYDNRYDIAGKLNGGANLGAFDATAGVVKPVFSHGSDTDYDSAEKKCNVLGYGRTAMMDSFSFSMWHYPTVDEASTILCLGNLHPADYRGYQLDHSTVATGRYYLRVVTSASTYTDIYTAGTFSAINAWYFVSIAFDNDTDTWTIRVNDNAEASAVAVCRTGPSIINSYYAPTMLARRTSKLSSTFDQISKCRMDQTIIWTGRAIGQAEHDYLYNSGNGRLYADW